MLILEFDGSTQRSNPRGLHVGFSIESTSAIKRLEIGLEDGEPDFQFDVRVQRGTDGRYLVGLNFKPVINGTWPLTVRAWDSNNREGFTTCKPGVAVTF